MISPQTLAPTQTPHRFSSFTSGGRAPHGVKASVMPLKPQATAIRGSQETQAAGFGPLVAWFLEGVEFNLGWRVAESVLKNLGKAFKALVKTFHQTKAQKP
jgi:hypothetical protein